MYSRAEKYRWTKIRPIIICTKTKSNEGNSHLLLDNKFGEDSFWKCGKIASFCSGSEKCSNRIRRLPKKLWSNDRFRFSTFGPERLRAVHTHSYPSYRIRYFDYDISFEFCRANEHHDYGHHPHQKQLYTPLFSNWLLIQQRNEHIAATREQLTKSVSINWH